LDGGEFRDTEPLLSILPDNPDRHAASYQAMIAADEIGKEVHPFFQFYDRNHVRQIILERGVKGLVVNRESKYLSSAFRRNPFLFE
jgi:hypothetical protein